MKDKRRMELLEEVFKVQAELSEKTRRLGLLLEELREDICRKDELQSAAMEEAFPPT